MASIRFEMEDSEQLRRELGALGTEFTAKSGKVVIFFPDVQDSEALFLAVKGITGHGMVAALDNGRKENAADPKTNFGGHATIEEYERESARPVAAKTDTYAERMSKEEAARRAEEDSTFRLKEPEVVMGKAANEKDKEHLSVKDKQPEKDPAKKAAEHRSEEKAEIKHEAAVKGEKDLRGVAKEDEPKRDERRHGASAKKEDK